MGSDGLGMVRNFCETPSALLCLKTSVQLGPCGLLGVAVSQSLLRLCGCTRRAETLLKGFALTSVAISSFP